MKKFFKKFFDIVWKPENRFAIILSVVLGGVLAYILWCGFQRIDTTIILFGDTAFAAIFRTVACAVLFAVLVIWAVAVPEAIPVVVGLLVITIATIITAIAVIDVVDGVIVVAVADVIIIAITGVITGIIAGVSAGYVWNDCEKMFFPYMLLLAIIAGLLFLTVW